MGSSKFFTNEPVGDHQERRLLKEFEAISQEMRPDWTFRAVTGYLRLSSYLAVKEKLKDARKIQILVGIDAGDFAGVVPRPDDAASPDAPLEQKAKSAYMEKMRRAANSPDNRLELEQDWARFKEERKAVGFVEIV